MERKVGEIFEYNGEWYQCLKSPDGSCKHCDMGFGGKCPIPIKECTESGRNDRSYIIFKKLEKFGEPYEYFILGMGIIIVQEYILANASYIYDDNRHVVMMDCQNGRIAIEIKQNKEDMEEKKLNLKPFDLEAAKAGKLVCTRDGRKARIICFDAKCDKPIVALIYDCNKETVLQYLENGRFFVDQIDKYDLMMFPQKKEGWINIYTSYDGIETGISVYETKEIAKKGVDNSVSYLGTIKIEWEE